MVRSTQTVCAVALLFSLAACQRAPAPEPLPEPLPSAYTWPRWQHPLVHTEIQPFYRREIRITPNNRREFDRLVVIVLEALTRLRRLQLGGLSMEDHLARANRALRHGEGPRMPFGCLIYHTRRDQDGRLAAEGITLSLGREVENGTGGPQLFVVHVRLEDRVEGGGVDGDLDDLQFIIDTGTRRFGGVEVAIRRQRGPLGEDHFDYTLSRLEGRRATSRQRSIAYRGEDNRLIVDFCEKHLWDLFRGAEFTNLIRGDPVGHLLPGEATRPRRAPRDIPLGTNFPALEKGE